MNDNAAKLAVAALAAFFLLRQQSPAAASAVSVAEQDTSQAPKEADDNPENVVDLSEWDNPLTPLPDYPSDTPAQTINIDDWDNPYIPLEITVPSLRSDFVDNVGDPIMNLNAFLFMIRASEHVYPRDVVNDACYNIFYGGSTFDDMSDHPVNTGEKRGVPLADSMCRAVGLNPGCVSTAAGAYQIIRPTWNNIRKISPRLPDFSRDSQDQAAIRLLDQVGALALISEGDIKGAIKKASKLWASLPGSTAQQNPKKLQFALDRFEEGLTLA